MTKPKVLIVDDEEYILQMLSEAVRSAGYEAFTAPNGIEALKFMKDNAADIVITDIMMPDINGVKLFYQMKKIDPFLQVILITAYPSLQNIVEMLEAGASDFIIKPFDINKFKAILSETVSRVERWRKLRLEWLEYKKKMKSN